MALNINRKYHCGHWILCLSYAVLLDWVVPPFSGLAFGQGIQPDSTLGSEGSDVSEDVFINDKPSDLIIGGARRGANLFHSFDRFNVNEVQGANFKSVYFDNPSAVERIITRVTGSSSSEILGTLGVYGGSADLFLLNPNGIIFGPNASLDLKGSFLATTASSYIFPNAEYSAFNPSSVSPLNVDIPIGLQFRSIPGSIIIQSLADGPILPGLQVQRGKSLVLVGGNVVMDGGYLSATGGRRIELGSISGFGQVTLEPSDWSLGYENISIENFGDIDLKNKSFITSFDEDGGDISLHGKNVTIAEDSAIGTLVTGSNPGGMLTISASNSLVLKGGSYIVNTSFGTGDVGNIAIDVKKVFLQDKSYIQTTSSFKKFSPEVTVTSSGNSGTVTITTAQIEISGGSYVTASTPGIGKGGSIQINSSDSINIFGVSSVDTDSGDRTSSGLYAFSQVGSSGQAGDITLNTRLLRVADEGTISARSEGIGPAGDIKINASSIRLENSGSLDAQTTAGFGNISLNANDIVLRDNSKISTNATGTANGGNITINTGVLVGFENSDIVANAFTGSGGRVEISAKGIFGLVPRTRVELEQLLGTTDPLQLDPSQLPSSDITAISQSDPSLNGQVILNTPEVDPSKGLVELPTTVVDPNSLVAQSPCRRGTRSEFTRSGRGGLPPGISQDFNSDATQVALVEPVLSSPDKQQTNPLVKTFESKTSALGLESPVVPAQGWVFNKKGEVVLVADNAVVAGPQLLKTNPAGCPIP